MTLSFLLRLSLPVSSRKITWYRKTRGKRQDVRNHVCVEETQAGSNSAIHSLTVNNQNDRTLHNNAFFEALEEHPRTEWRKYKHYTIQRLVLLFACPLSSIEYIIPYNHKTNHIYRKVACGQRLKNTRYHTHTNKSTFIPFVRFLTPSFFMLISQAATTEADNFVLSYRRCLFCTNNRNSN